ncbi:DMT family transporter [Shimia sp. R10_1]|uniref:DMT family transporter n=1 Tax=Shimia sp. R10_1 TaxID=2821095 RepID=UPI001ADBC44F|nr:DMT family transporter [Shimia sp. R10_1]MBO9473397.1 DMT family transporter [Shimia sp. R10_1]
MDRISLLGGAAVFAYSIAITGADSLTKLIAQEYPPAQFFALAGFLVAGFSVVSAWCCCKPGESVAQKLSTRQPRLMALRSALGFVASVSFYFGFRLLPLAEMFLFIGLMPLLVALLSGPLLKEPVQPFVWIALVVGSLGVTCLFFQHNTMLGVGHVSAILGCGLGAVSLVVARRMTREDRGCLAQVFWPNLAVGCGMLVVLPFGFLPMPIGDIIWVCAYGAAVFCARVLCVAALTLLPVFVVTPLMNIQFIWALIIGAVVFGDPITGQVLLGGVLIVASGLVLMWDITPEYRERYLSAQ